MSTPFVIRMIRCNPIGPIGDPTISRPQPLFILLEEGGSVNFSLRGAA